MQIEGDITYNGEPFSNFFPQRTSAYVDQASLCLSTGPSPYRQCALTNT